MDRGIARVLVPVDFSSGSVNAARRALELARGVGARIELLHVVDTGALAAPGGPAAVAEWQRLAEEVVERARVVAREHAHELDPGGQVITAIEVIQGRPVDTIVERASATGCDLIVMGTLGRTGLARVVIGSVAERVARLAPCDVLIVRERSP